MDTCKSKYVDETGAIISKITVRKWKSGNYESRGHLCGENGQPLCGSSTNCMTESFRSNNLLDVECHWCAELLEHRPEPKKVKQLEHRKPNAYIYAPDSLVEAMKEWGKDEDYIIDDTGVIGTFRCIGCDQELEGTILYAQGMGPLCKDCAAMYSDPTFWS